MAWARRDRVAAVHLRLVSVALPLLPVLILWLGAAAILRALARLTLKQPDRAMAEITAYLLAVFRPAAWIRARWRARKGRTMSRREYRRLLAGIRPTLRQRRDRLSSYLRAQEEAWAEPAPLATPSPTRTRPAKKGTRVANSGRPAEASRGAWAVRRPRADELVQTPSIALEPGEELVVDLREPAHPLDDPTAGEPITPGPVLLEGADEIRFDDERDLPVRRASLRIGLFVALLTGVAGLIALRVLLRGTGVPVGDALIPAPATAGKLWSLGLTSWRPTGLGLAAAADPFDLVLALISWPFAGSTRLATSFLLIAALPLSALSAWWTAAALTRSRALRAWAALVWAAAPSLILSVTAGRLGAIVAHLMLPLTALALTRAVGLRPVEPLGPSMPGMVRRRRASMAAASAAGLALTVLIAAAPALALPALLAVLTLLFLATAGRRLLVWTLVVPAVLLIPWWQAVAKDPRLLLAEPGGASAVLPGSPGWAAALWPADPAVINHGPVHRLARVVADLTGLGDAGVWLRVFAVVVVVPPLLLGLLALTGHLRRRVARTAWLVGLIALGTAVAIPVVNTRQSSDGLLHGWSGPAVSLFLLTLVIAALSNLDGAAGRLRARSIGIGHWSAVAVGALAVLTPMLVLTSWAADGWTGSPNRWVHRADPDVLPAVAAAEADGPAATRTLTLQATAEGVRWTLYRTGGPQIGQESAASLTPAAVAARSAGDKPVLETIGALLSASGEDQRERFADLDIGSVLLLTSKAADARSDAADAAVAALDVAPGLVRVSSSDGKMLWRVELAGVASDSETAGTDERSNDDANVAGADASDQAVPTRPARVRVLASDGDLITTVPASGVDFTASVDQGAAGRLLVLSERADPGWTATLDGAELDGTTYKGWAQAFRLPMRGGTLAVRHEETTSSALGLSRIVVLGLALLVAVPLPRRRLRLLIPQKGWRPQQPAPVPAGSTGRRVRRPGDAQARPRGTQGTEDPAQAYADHQARMTELARRLAIESEDEDPMTARPSRRRRRAARQAAEAMAAEAKAAGGSAPVEAKVTRAKVAEAVVAAGARVTQVNGTGSVAGGSASAEAGVTQAETAGVAAGGSAAVGVEETQAEVAEAAVAADVATADVATADVATADVATADVATVETAVVQAAEAGVEAEVVGAEVVVTAEAAEGTAEASEAGSDDTGAAPVTDADALAVSRARVPSAAEGSAEAGSAESALEAHVGRELAEGNETPSGGTDGEVTGVIKQPETQPEIQHILRPGRAGSTRSLPPGPRGPKESETGPIESPRETGDSRSDESAAKSAGLADSADDDPRSGDAASPDGSRETSSGTVRPQGAPADSGEEESS